jgi:uncharacterized circularly permuted ATP-grasp superfamily protein
MSKNPILIVLTPGVISLFEPLICTIVGAELVEGQDLVVEVILFI